MTDPWSWGGLLQTALLPLAASIIHISLRLKGLISDLAQQAEEALGVVVIIL